METRFRNRTHAGQLLAAQLSQYANRPDLVVLALPRGGVPVAFEVAIRLGAPLDVFVVRKLGVPDYPELAMGAIAPGGIRVLNPDVLVHIRHIEDILEEITSEEAAELERRERLYREGRPALELAGRRVIVVDDGLATGATMRAAVAALRHSKVSHIVVAVPVGAASTCARLEREADEIVCLTSPEDFGAVGHFYDDFSQTSDQEVRELLSAASRLSRQKQNPSGPNA